MKYFITLLGILFINAVMAQETAVVSGKVFGNPSENIIENFALKPEVSSNFNMGFKFGQFTWDKHQLSLSSSLFLRDTKDKIVQQFNDRQNEALQTSPFVNESKVKTFGFEAEMQYIFRNKWTLMFNGSRFNSVFNKQFDANGREFSYYNQQLPNEPFFTLNSSLQSRFNHFIARQSILNLYYSFGFVERFYINRLEMDSFRTPRQYVHHLGASFTFPNQRFIISLDAKNLFNAQVYDNFAVQKPGRGFYLKLNYMLNNIL